VFTSSDNVPIEFPGVLVLYYKARERSRRAAQGGLSFAVRATMKLPLQITFHGGQPSYAIEHYVRQRAKKLDTFAPRLISCRVAIAMPHRRPLHDEHYRVRIDITTPGGEVVVERIPEGDHEYEDAYTAVDAAFDDAGRRLQDFVRRPRGDEKRPERARYDAVTKLFPYERYGFLRTPKKAGAMPDGIEVDFCRTWFRGGVDVVVTIGADIYGATDLEPVTALHAAARKAAEDLARRGHPLDPNAIVEQGQQKLKACTSEMSAAVSANITCDSRPR
jgi:ribosome-associated translation inhibitor RaiA